HRPRPAKILCAVFASTKSLGRYTLLEQIARGGMAQVFLAQRDGAATCRRETSWSRSTGR
ncbi:MAG: hypothetical protein RL846_46565, partial [Deltaproteobacteria bacterium]